MGTCTNSSSSSMSSIMTILPNDVIANEILGKGYLSDKTIQRFLSAVGERRATKLYKLDQQFCLKHGSKLEDSNQFHAPATRNDKTEDDNGEGEQQQQQTRSLCCPECYAEAQHSKRCNGCKKFQPEYCFGSNSNNNSAGPGLCCQQCHKMEFCHECLSNTTNNNDAETDTDTDTDAGQQLQHQRKQQYNSRNQFGPGRVTCHNCCCPNRNTNTMCGEFVCHDCHEEHHHANSNSNENNVAVEVCEECAKSTCLDPHCYVCADFKLSTLSTSCECGFGVGVPKAAELLRIRKAVTDVLIYSLCGWIVYQIWYGGDTITTTFQNATLLIN